MFRTAAYQRNSALEMELLEMERVERDGIEDEPRMIPARFTLEDAVYATQDELGEEPS